MIATVRTILYILLFAILATYAVGGILAAPWVPTRKRQRKWIADIVPLRDGDVVVDIGCGDGAMLFAFLDKNPRIKAKGFEISLLPYAIARLRVLSNVAYRSAKIRYRDFFRESLADADVVFFFLMEAAYPKVVKKLSRELKDDCLVVAKVWPLPGIEPIATYRTEGLLPIYLYRGGQFKTK